MDDWKLEAACRGLQTNLFFPEKGDQHTLKTALEICNGTDDTEPCPVKQQCLDWILTTFNRDEDLYGIYGGLLPAQRVKLRKPSVHVPVAVTKDRIERDNPREQALAELLNLVHEVVLTEMLRSEHQRLAKYKESISIEREQQY